MKCPKCGYISFDFNKKCPKCQKDIISDREKMNHLSFKPEPPFLLEALLAQLGDSSVGVQVDASAIDIRRQESMLTLGDDVTSDARDVGTGEEKAEIEMSPPGGELVLSIEDMAPEEEGPVETQIDVSTESDESVETVTTEPDLGDEEQLSLELEHLFEGEQESGPEGESEMAFDSFDIGDAELVEENTQPGDEIILEADVDSRGPSSSEETYEMPSLDKMNGDDNGQYDTPHQANPQTGQKHPSASHVSGSKGSKQNGVWDKISKDLEDLDFDIDES